MKSKVNKFQTKNLKTALKKNSRLHYKFVKKGIINFKLVVATVLAQEKEKKTSRKESTLVSAAAEKKEQ